MVGYEDFDDVSYKGWNCDDNVVENGDDNDGENGDDNNGENSDDNDGENGDDNDGENGDGTESCGRPVAGPKGGSWPIGHLGHTGAVTASLGPGVILLN